MNTKLLPLLALPVLLGACESFNMARLPQTPPPVQLASRATTWGELPTYDMKGQFFKIGPLSSLKNFPTEGTGGRVTIDLLVNRDGTVRALKVTESSGDMKADRAAMELFRNARYTLKLAESDPAPYVVTQTVELKMVVQAGERSRRGIDYGRDFHEAPAYTEGYQVGTTKW